MGMFRRGGLPPKVYTSLGAIAGGKPTILAWASTGLGYAVGLEDRLLWTVPDTRLRRETGNTVHLAESIEGVDERSEEHGWDEVPWHEIQHGGWRPDDQELYWTTVDGVDGVLGLTDPGTLPALFRERVEATILFQLSFMPPETSREVTISGRRPLGRDAKITWSWSQAPGGKLTPTALDAVESEVRRIATEYDAG